MELAHQEYKTYKSLYKALHRQTQEGGADGGAPGMRWRDFRTDAHAIPQDITTMKGLLDYAGISLEGTDHTPGDYILKIRCKPHTHPAHCWGNADRVSRGEGCPEQCEQVDGRALEWGDKACRTVFGQQSSKGCITWNIPSHCRPVSGPRHFTQCITQGAAQWRLVLREIDQIKEAIEDNVERLRKALDHRNTEKFKHLRAAQGVVEVQSRGHGSALHTPSLKRSRSLGNSNQGAMAHKRRDSL